MVECDALEMRFGATQRGFESPPLRFIKVLANYSLSNWFNWGLLKIGQVLEANLFSQFQHN